MRPVPVQMWQGRAQSRCRCERGEPQSLCGCGRGEPSPGADVAGVSPVPVQTWVAGPSPGAVVAGTVPSPGARGERGEPSPGAEVAAGGHRLEELVAAVCDGQQDVLRHIALSGIERLHDRRATRCVGQQDVLRRISRSDAPATAVP